MPERLTPTSYALLGLLNLQPFSAYELTQYMRRGALARLWPRTEASIYREPKALVAGGLARARNEADGRRSRTVYEITPAGRRALRSWLGRPGRGLRFECEAAVQAFFGDAADLESLRANLGSVRAASLAARDSSREMLADWLEGRLRFPDRLQYTTLAADLIARVEHAVGSWAEDWLERIDAWEGTELHEASERQARALLRELEAVGPPQR